MFAFITKGNAAPCGTTTVAAVTECSGAVLLKRQNGFRSCYLGFYLDSQGHLLGVE